MPYSRFECCASINKGHAMIKDIVVNLSLNATKDIAGDFALSVANTFDAHLAAVAYQYRFEVPGTVFAASALTAVIDEQRAESVKASQDAIARFERAAKAAGVAIECRTPEVTLDEAPRAFAELARTYDLAVMRQPNPDEYGPEELLAEGALFGAGRPLLVVPYIQNRGLKLNRISMCWDGSRTAARAVADALPFLKKSDAVEIVMVHSKEGIRTEIAGTDIAQHLARHGVKVELTRLTVPDMDVAPAILSHIADWGSDLLVMGGYGHSRLREFILGGVTREIMRSMTVPTLMSH
jgi:nucleotide-binding universal stress UspA family protein